VQALPRCQTPATAKQGLKIAVSFHSVPAVSSVFLGIDYGSKRVGLSHGDELGFAFPLAAATSPDAEERFSQIGREITRLKVTQLVLGYPLSLEGEKTKRCLEVDAFAAELTQRFGLPIELVDEGLTSQAADALSGQRKPRSSKERQDQTKSGERDSRAAAVLLQDFLNSRGFGA
jgi:putative Holliday junction resolvase